MSDWKDDPTPELVTVDGQVIQRQGLCADCMVQFTSSLVMRPYTKAVENRPGWTPFREHWMSASEYKRAWHDWEYRSALYEKQRLENPVTMDEWEETYVRELLSWPNCEQCPTWHGKWDFTPPTQQDRAGVAPRCKDCSRRANLEGWMRYPLTPMTPKVGMDDPQEYWDATTIAIHADVLVANARTSLLRAEPRCEKCPIPAPPKPKSESGVEPKILAGLAGFPGPATVGDILGFGVKGLTKNNIAKMMRGMVESGAVTLTTEGPRKFFELP